VLLTVWWDMQVDALKSRVGELFVCVVTSIRARRRRLTPKHAFDLGSMVASCRVSLVAVIRSSATMIWCASSITIGLLEAFGRAIL
jgi:hypothetical protein